MVVNQPHFLLFTDAHLSQSRACAVSAQGFGRWHFVLERLDGPERLEAADSETDVHRDRLALLAVVRGLEALEQPSQVTLVTTSRYVSRGLRYGLNEWREAEYTWEHFGMHKPIRNADLWQRIDGAMSFHQVTCRLLQSPLAQAVVETATEMDELTMLTNPLDAPFDIVSDRANESRTTAAFARREPAAGLIQRVDSAHGSIGLANIPQTKLLQAGGLTQVGIAPALVGGSSSGHSTSIPQESELIKNISLNELQLSKIPTRFRRPKISITLPNLGFQWIQIALSWFQRWRWSLAEAFARMNWIRRGDEASGWNRTQSVKPHPVIVPT